MRHNNDRQWIQQSNRGDDNSRWLAARLGRYSPEMIWGTELLLFSDGRFLVTSGPIGLEVFGVSRRDCMKRLRSALRWRDAGTRNGLTLGVKPWKFEVPF